MDELLGFKKDEIKKSKSVYIHIIGTRWEYRQIKEKYEKYFKKLNSKTKINPFGYSYDAIGTNTIWIFPYHSYSDFFLISKEKFYKNIAPALLVKVYLVILLELPPTFLMNLDKDKLVKEINKDLRMSNITKHFLGLECKCKSCSIKSINKVII